MPKLHVGTSGAGSATAMPLVWRGRGAPALVPPVVYVRCGACGTAWAIRDRRQARRVDVHALGRFLPEDKSR